MSDEVTPLRKWGTCFAKPDDELEFGLRETLDIGETRIIWCVASRCAVPPR